MPRRVNLPPADELFRKTAPDPAAAADDAEISSGAPGAQSAPSGRVRHNEKMTVYLTSEELLAVEQARLKLRGDLGRTIDRGRLVRTALDIVLGELAEHGSDSEIARRLAAS
ncbi:MAG TPA: hypothetical protein VK948_03030 [Aeromicrobium sp.]|nr:hypothetical protein [Aeromicrobium sp.]